jgi:hypothetical protein
VKLEAYNTVSIRDWWVGFGRNEAEGQWQVDMKIHCETPDSGIDHSGTFAITISDDEGGQQVIKTYEQEAVLKGDANREVTSALISFVVPDSQVRT